MVLYTQAAMLGAGGQAAMDSQVQLGIDETNLAYQSTGITQRIRLVYRGVAGYLDSGDLRTDLTRLAFSGDGFLDQVHALRNSYRADIVSLWVEQPGDLCGLGYGMDSLSLSEAPYAFNVVGRRCATSNYTFAHEMGHNMGAQHDRLNAESPGLYSFSYGYQEPAAIFRTIMAYDCPTGCPRLPFFSSPNYAYSGRPIGTLDADNTLTLNLSAPIVANFANSAGPTAPLAGFAFVPQNPQVGQSVAFTDTSTGSPADWSWRFDDGTSSELRNPTHTFSTPGVYSVLMHSQNTGGWSDGFMSRITVSPASATLNLAPFQPSGWSGKIVVGRSVAQLVDSTELKPSDTLYVSWAVINTGTGATQASFLIELYLDGALRQTWRADSPVNSNFYVHVSDFSIGSLPAGTHSLRIMADSTNTIAETNEADNEFTKTIVVGTTSCNRCPRVVPFR